MTTPAPTTHPDEGALLALLDGERVEEVASHVAACAPCADRLALLRRRSAALSALLRDALPAPAPERPRLPDARRRPRVPTPLVAAAAAVFVLAGVGLGMALHERGLRARGARATPPPAAATPAPPPRVAPAAAAVSFVPADTLLEVRFDAAQRTGRVVIRATDGERVSARIMGARAGESVLVLPSAVRFRNADGSAASYELLVPRAVRALRLVVAGRAQVVHAAEGLARTVPVR